MAQDAAGGRPTKQGEVMINAVIVDAVRTAGGKRNGQLSGWHPADLAGEVLSQLAQRSDLDPGVVDDVVFGCGSQVGDQAMNVGRNAVLAAGWPESVPATTVDRQCGSSQQAAHFAAQGVMSGAYDVAVAAGVELMSTTPMGSSSESGKPFGPRMIARYESVGGLVHQGTSAEMIADHWGLTRHDLDVYGARSQQRAFLATEERRFDNEIVPVEAKRWNSEAGEALATGAIFDRDEGIRPDTTTETLARLSGAFREGGKVTAGNSSQITDGASAILIMSEERADSLGLVPRARFHSFALAGVDPVMMLTGPIDATKKVLARAGLTMDEIDVAEVNEAFASVVLAWQLELDADLERVNVNGGAISLGHPIGASGTKLTATLLNELERSGGRYGLQVMCEGGGLANAMIIERLG